MTDNEKQKPSGQFGVDKASGADKSITHQLTIDELPKHTNSFVVQDTGNYLPAQYGQVKAEPKHWYQSKTIWFNLIITAMTLATSATPSLEALMTPEVYGVLATGVAFINAILRLLTGKPIKGGGNG